jgi:DnaJ-class molecular chaperone
MECNGKGKKRLDQGLVIDVPAGTYHGAKVNPTNDLQVQVLYLPHKEFKLMNNMIDILSEKEIDMFTAILGGSVIVNTLEGVKTVKIPAGCQPETTLRIRQAGMKIKHKAGDHLLNIKVKLPSKLELTEEQQKLLQTLQEQMEEKKNG